MTQNELDVMWSIATRKSIENSQPYTRYEFAKLVAAKEREACAELCMGLHTLTDGAHNYYHFAANQILSKGET